MRDAREVSEMSALFGVMLHHPRPLAFLLGDQLGAWVSARGGGCVFIRIFAPADALNRSAKWVGGWMEGQRKGRVSTGESDIALRLSCRIA